MPGHGPSAPSLRELQRDFAARIVQVHDADVPSPWWAVPPPRGTIDDRIAVYRGGYPARLQDALAETYPAVAHIIGQGALHDLTHRYARALTLHTYNLSDIGAELPAFLANDPLAERLPFLPDLATLEWSAAQAFHAFDLAPFDAATLQTWTLTDFAAARVELQPSVDLVSSDWPLRELWESQHVSIDEIDLALVDRPDRVLVYRAAGAVSCASVSADEADVVRRLLASEPLGQITAALADRGGDPSAVTACFARLSGLGLITRCTRP